MVWAVFMGLSVMYECASSLWAKSGTPPHPLLSHMLDTAAVAIEILHREPPRTRAFYANDLGVPEEEAVLWTAFFAGLHDFGKASPVFQRTWPQGAAQIREVGLNWDETLFSVRENWVAHWVLTQLFLEEALKREGFPQSFYRPLARGLAAHHGFVPREDELYKARLLMESEPSTWKEARSVLMEMFHRYIELSGHPKATSLNPLATLRFMALASFSDWLASDPRLFPYGRVPQPNYFEEARKLARNALDSIGWRHRKFLFPCSLPDFQKVFEFKPNSLQNAVIKALSDAEGPVFLMVEAPMGLGKTEAALYAHLLLQPRCEHRGFYAALPTQATGNGLFPRVKKFLTRFAEDTPLDLQLQHGAALLNPEYQSLKPRRVGELGQDEGVVAEEWFSQKKRAMLSGYGVGTLDQALLGVLKVKHHFIRLWGLMNRTVILDEVHAYDTYTSGLLKALIQWLKALGSSVIMMTATLPPRKRRELLEAWGIKAEDLGSYPRVVVADAHGVQAYTVPLREKKVVQLCEAPVETETLAREVSESLPGCIGIIVNTVDRAQELYRFFGKGTVLRLEELLQSEEVRLHLERLSPCDRERSVWAALERQIKRYPHKGKVVVGKHLPDGTLIFLLHARFPAGERALRELVILALFGKEGPRFERAVLIGTQVIEQSLDLDFDLLFSDLAPIDLLFQRSGRLHRHSRTRPKDHVEPVFRICGLSEPNFGPPLYWDHVYEEYVLLSTWLALVERHALQLPDDLEPLLEEVYEREPRSFPDDLQERAEKALQAFEQRRTRDEEIARNLALFDMEALVGSGRRGEDIPRHFGLDDEAEDARTQRLLTRLGPPSVPAVFLYRVGDSLFLDPERSKPAPLCGGLEVEEIRDLYERSVRLSRHPIPKILLEKETPPAWRRHGVVRNFRPLEVGQVFGDFLAELDPELGVVYRKIT